MDIRSSSTPEGRTYHLAGRFDAHQVPQFKAALKDQAGSRLELDFSDVSFIDSTGLATLVSLFKTTSSAGGELRITGVQDQVFVIFEITRLHTVLPLERVP